MTYLTNKIQNAKTIALISNYKYSQKIEEFTDSYDLVVRFNEGSNQLSLEKKLHQNFNHKIDICVLSGWKNAYFGDMRGFYNKNILFSRPLCKKKLLYNYKHICIQKRLERQLSAYTQNIFYIPLSVFYKFYEQYKYDHPTTGLITAYYLSKYFTGKINCINFFVDASNNTIYNAFIGQTSLDKHIYHNLKLELSIFNSLNIDNIIL